MNPLDMLAPASASEFSAGVVGNLYGNFFGGLIGSMKSEVVGDFGKFAGKGMLLFYESGIEWSGNMISDWILK